MKTPEEIIGRYIIKGLKDSYPEEFKDKSDEEVQDSDYYNDYLDEFRCSGEDTDIKDTNFSRHYESKQVARVLDIDGEKIAIGWTYWSGGGKHGEPSAMPWLEDAYFCDFKQEMRLVSVFTKK